MPAKGVGAGTTLAGRVVAKIEEGGYGFSRPGGVYRKGGDEVVVETSFDG